MLYEKYEPPVTRSQVSACVPGEPTGDLSHGAHPGEGGGNGRVTVTRTITETVTITETDTETDIEVLEEVGFRSIAGRWSKGDRWEVDEYRCLWECFMLSCYRENDGSRSWRELLMVEWKRRGGREVLEGTLMVKLNNMVGRNLLPRVELEQIEKRIMKLMTSEGALVAIKTEEEDEEAFADRTFLEEKIDEVEWKDAGCYRGVISEVFQEVFGAL